MTMMLKFILTLLCGLLLPLAFAPFNIYSIAFISPAILLFIWLKSAEKQAFLLGWMFGIGFFGVGISWIYISIHQFGNASVFLSVLITTLFVLFLALFPAAQAWIFRKFFSRSSEAITCLCAFPALWVTWEYLRTILFTGFPWLFLGYAQLNTPLHGFAPLIGVYGLSFLTALIAGALVLLATRQTFFIKMISLILIFGFVGMGYFFSKHTWTKPIDQPIRVSLIQGNIPQSIKWDPSFLAQNMNIYKELTFEHWSSELIVWPEGAFPVVAQNSSQFIYLLGKAAEKHQATIIFGAPIENIITKQYYNGLLMIGKNQGEYWKQHLVPFGEYVPIAFIFQRVMNYFAIPMSAFSPGPSHQSLLQFNDILIAPFICYEIAYPAEVLNRAEKSNVLLTISDDSWFGRSIALAQHLQMAQMRALEMGRYVLLSTNTGITAFISPMGTILKGAPIDQRMVITDNIQPMTGKTPLMMWKYYPMMIVVILLLCVARLRSRSRF